MDSRRQRLIHALTFVFLSAGSTTPTGGQDKPAAAIDVTRQLAGFDGFMERTLNDWNAPGIGVGIVVGDKLVFAKGLRLSRL